MKLCFDSIEEVKLFVAALKGTRGKKGEEESGDAAVHQAPAPLMPPQAAPQAFQAAAAPQFSPPAAFPIGPGTDPAVMALVGRINTRIDGAIASGQPADQVLTWFRGQCGAEAGNATMDQIKANFLPKLSMAALENIAKLMNA
jgi:hypothetical protein